jgi:hypothetical protein
VHPIRHARLVLAIAMTLVALVPRADGQDLEDVAAPSTMNVGGQTSMGVPDFCATPTVVSVGSGAWSDPAVWSTRAVPGAGDAVVIERGHQVTYDRVADVPLACVAVSGQLRFSAGMPTRLTVGTLLVRPSGTLEIGTVQDPVEAGVVAEVVIADQELDPLDDVEQFGTGVIGQGRVRIHGAPVEPAFARLAVEPLKGQQALTLERPPDGWRVGDRLVIPDTRQLRLAESGAFYQPQWEELTVAGIAGAVVTLSRPLEFDHRGARDGGGRLEWLPHVASLSRNVVIRSANPSGVRGHVLFTGRADVDIRFALFKDLGRTRPGPLDSAVYDANGVPRNFGTNQIGRYSLHMHHNMGPESPQSNGYEFTLVGNVVDGGSKWGIAVHDSHYGLVRDNVVYDVAGAAIVTEDGNETANLFEHNFAMRVRGSGEFAPRSGYTGGSADPGGEGSGFWLRGPNNILRDNVAANVDVSGFAIAAGGLGVMRIPVGKGADTMAAGESEEVDMATMPVLGFSGNEAYGALQTGVTIGWNATLTATRVWHASRSGLTAYPVDRLDVENFAARSDPSALTSPLERPVGIWFGNYAAKTVTIRDADVQGFRVGISSPFFARLDSEPGRGNGVATIVNGYLRNQVGVAVATFHAMSDPGAPRKSAIVRNVRFDPLPEAAADRGPSAAISMNYGSSAGDAQPRAPIDVFGFNGTSDAFRVYYSLGAPEAAPPCTGTRPGIDGYVCPGPAVQRPSAAQ